MEFVFAFCLVGRKGLVYKSFGKLPTLAVRCARFRISDDLAEHAQCCENDDGFLGVVEGVREVLLRLIILQCSHRLPKQELRGGVDGVAEEKFL